MDAESFPGLKILDYQFAGELEPCGALSAEVLQEEAVATEDAGAERLLESDADLNLRRCAEKSVSVNHVLVAGANLDRHDVAGKLGGEG